MTAITNLEKLLSGDESVKPTTRIEQIVKGIDIKPLTHFEQIVCGYDIPPMNRLEQIIKGLDVGGYRSREEYFWGEWASGHGEIEYVGSVPFSVIAKGGNVSAYQIWGNAPYQEHTPSPDNPCEVKGVGEKTGNLFDGSVSEMSKYLNSDGEIISSSAFNISDYIPCDAETTYTIKNVNTDSVSPSVCFYSSQKDFLGGVNYNRKTGVTFGTPVDCVYLRVSYRKNMAAQAMLNEGSTALPYEPYGYKIPVVSEGKNLFDGKYNVGYTGQYPNISEDSTGCSSEWIETNKIDNTIKIILSINTEGNYVFGYVVSNDKEQILYRQGVSNTSSQEVNAKRVVTLMESTINTIKSYKFVKFYYSRRQYYNYYGVYFTNETEYTSYRPPITTTIYTEQPYFTDDYVRKDKDGGVEHREWGEYVCTGDENIQSFSGTYAHRYALSLLQNKGSNRMPMRSTHFKYIGSNLQDGKNGELSTSGGSNFRVWLWSDIKTDAEFLQFLKSEYDKGTPVTIYYPLSTPTDTDKDLPEILLVNGYNGIDTDTEIKPEKMTLTYRVGKETAEADARLTAEFLNMMEEM